MHTKKPFLLNNKLSPILFFLFTAQASACGTARVAPIETIIIQDKIECTPAGLLSLGSNCSHTGYVDIFSLTALETIDMLEAQSTPRTCVQVPNMNVCKEDQSIGEIATLPARGAAVYISSTDSNQMKTEHDTMCRELGTSCIYAPTPTPSK